VDLDAMSTGLIAFIFFRRIPLKSQLYLEMEEVKREQKDEIINILFSDPQALTPLDTIP